MLSAVALAGRVGGEPNRPEWRWRTIETEHFAVHFPVPRRAGHPVAADETAAEVARIAERAWPELALANGSWPRSRIHLVIRDDGDALVGRAVPPWDLVTLSVHPGRDLLRARGRTDALGLVVVHEIAHVLSHARASAISRASAVGPELGGVGWAGPVGVGGALRLPGGAPSGWSEGRAEWLAEQAGVTWWGAERAMSLRVAALADELPSWRAWSLTPESDLWGIGEQRYQAGYAFGRRYPDAFARVSAASAERWVPIWPWRRAFGTSGSLAWEAFSGLVRAEAELWQTARLPVTGRPTAPAPDPDREAEQVLWPRMSTDGRWVAEQRGGWTGAFPQQGGDSVWVPGGAGYAFVPGADALIVGSTRRGARPPPRDGFSRLFRVDLGCGAAARCAEPIPGTVRASDPAVSPDGAALAWLRFSDGRHEVWIAGIDGSDPRRLDAPRARLSGLSFAPDGARLATAAFVDGQQDLWTVPVDGSPASRLTDSPPAEDDPAFAADGSLLFVADVDGATDVFRLRDGRITRVTRVPGGAATPSVDPSGDLRYAAFDAFGWRAWRLPAGEWLDVVEPAFDSPWTRGVPPAPPAPPEDVPYRAIRAMRPASVIPVLRLEPADAPALGAPAPRGGAWLQTVDAVENVSLDGLFLLGVDALAAGSVTWRGWLPDLSLELSHAGRLDGLAPRALERASAGMDLPVYGPLHAHATALGFLLEGAPGAWATAGLSVDDRRAEAGGWVTAARTATPWVRLDGQLYGLARLGHDDHQLRLGGEGGWTDRRVEDVNRMFLGGDHPAAWLTAQLQGSAAFPALPAYAATGDAVAVARVRWQIPLATGRAVALGPITGTDLLISLGADAGDAWDLGAAPVLAPAGVADVRWRADLAGSPWDGCVRGAWTPGADPRLYVSLGSGW